jgi:tetratricopeptide (TPR) repeat protein
MDAVLYETNSDCAAQLLAAVCAEEGLPLPNTLARFDLSRALELDAEADRALRDGDATRCIELAKNALSFAPGWAQGLFRLGLARYTVGQFERAASIFGVCLALCPSFDPVHDLLPLSLLRAGSLRGALEAAMRIEAASPGNPDNHFQIARLALRLGDRDTARRWFDSGLSCKIPTTALQSLPFGTMSQARVRHDLLQLQWLREKGILRDHFAGASAGYAALASVLSGDRASEAISVDSGTLALIATFYRRCTSVGDPTRVDVALREDIDWDAVASTFHDATNECRYVVVDDLLSCAALTKLRSYLLDSTIWHNDAQLGRSYLGAYEGSGAHTELVDQIDDAMKACAPAIFEAYELFEVWAYRNVFGSTAIGVHADVSDLNVNIYVSPGHGNCDSLSGGMRIYRRRAARDWSFEDYNGSVDAIEAEVANVATVSIPFRENRAVIFDAKMFHGSDRCAFRSEYANLRTNVTLLYRRKAKGERGRLPPV